MEAKEKRGLWGRKRAKANDEERLAWEERTFLISSSVAVGSTPSVTYGSSIAWESGKKKVEAKKEERER